MLLQDEKEEQQETEREKGVTLELDSGEIHESPTSYLE